MTTDSVDAWVKRLRSELRRGGSAAVAKGSQRFFKPREEVASHGWRTADLRRYGRERSREILRAHDHSFLLEVADNLFTGRNNTEAHLAVMLLEPSVGSFGTAEFRRFEGWLDRITNWSQHDALVHSLLGELLLADPKVAPPSMGWTKSRNRWKRRAAAVVLVKPARARQCWTEIQRVTLALLNDQDDMVQKGVGWLLREAAKADRNRTLPFLLKIRARAPRLVLRMACETLAVKDRSRVLGS